MDILLTFKLHAKPQTWGIYILLCLWVHIPFKGKPLQASRVGAGGAVAMNCAGDFISFP